MLSLEDIDEPTIAARDVLVRVRAASLNSWDRDNLRGVFVNRLMLGLRRPKVRVLGGDIAGCVEAVGSEVTKFSVGDEVFGDLCNSGWGAFAEYARAPEQALTRKPAGISFAQAAAMPQAAVIALQGIRDHGAVQAGQHVLINGAGGGTGSFAVQLAKRSGALVTAVDSGPKLDMLRRLGADQVLDYRREDYTATGARYDFILDCEVHRPLSDCRRALAPRGRLSIVGGSYGRIAQSLPYGKWLELTSEQRIRLLFHEPNRALGELGQLATAGEITSVIEREYGLRELPIAMQRLCAGEIVGKAVVVIA